MKHLSSASTAILLATTLAATVCAAQTAALTHAIQAGAGNRAAIDQAHIGAEVRANVHQAGNANRATVSQRGEWRKGIGVQQTGNGNASLVQNGGANQGAIVQR